ncbi:GNAT family N-acetyltransferase [Pedobacter gandavensis]|uniref:GNAT family N-acetyltransferase n=1 Tax=Pedobacter gandavensis TaxID=2679963 RepID=UPI00292D0408|nr:GNAT family N-acetyltransferase [Pedobacter gandavensis]
MNKLVEIKKLNEDHIKEVTHLHDNSFKGFFLTSLGKSFLEVFYKGILGHEHGFGLGAFHGEELVGFAIGTNNNTGFYRAILKKNSLKMLLASFPNLIVNPSSVKRIILSLLSFKNTEYSDIPVLLSICVSGNKEAKGIGKKLLGAFENEIKVAGNSQLILTTDAKDNDYVNQFYGRNGYILVQSFLQHKREMNLYHKNV